MTPAPAPVTGAAPFCGVNLRRYDVPTFKSVCAHANIDPGAIPVLAVLNDDTPASMAESLYDFTGLDVRVWRCMSPNSQLPLRAPADGGIPLGAHIIGWNEMDELNDWWDSWWQEVRRLRPDLVIHYGAPNTDGNWPVNEPLEAALDVVDRHIGATFSPPASVIQGHPVWVTEIEVDLNYPETVANIPTVMEQCLQAGIPAFAWGLDPSTPDAAFSTTILEAIIKLNEGVSPMTDDPRIQQLLDQNAFLAKALYDVIKALNTSGVAGNADLIQDAKTNVNALNPALFTF